MTCKITTFPQNKYIPKTRILLLILRSCHSFLFKKSDKINNSDIFFLQKIKIPTINNKKRIKKHYYLP